MMSSRLVSTIRESRPCSFFYDLPDHDKGHAIRRDVVSDGYYRVRRSRRAERTRQSLREPLSSTIAPSSPSVMSMYSPLPTSHPFSICSDLAIPDAVDCFAIDPLIWNLASCVRSSLEGAKLDRIEIGQDTSERRKALPVRTGAIARPSQTITQRHCC